MDFLGSLMAGASKVLDPIFGGLGDELSKALFGRSDRLSLRDFEHYQNLMDRGNPREIARRQEWLAGVTPAEADSYNLYKDMTVGEDARRTKSYLDTVFPGTSPWERLGVNASAPQGMPDMGQSQGSQFLGQLTPLATAQIQANTQKQVAEIQARTQESVAKIHQDTELEKTGMTTNQGELPRSQTLESAARRFLTEAQTVTEGYTQHKISVETSAKQREILLNSAKAVWEMLPEEVVNFGMYNLRSRKGWETISKWLGSKEDGQETAISVQDMVSQLGDTEIDKLMRDTAQMASMIAKGGQAAKGIFRQGQSIVKGLTKGKKTPLQKKAAANYKRASKK